MDRANEGIRIDVIELLEICRLLLSKIIEQGTDEVFVDHDFYWSFLPEQRCLVYVEPQDFTIGQVSFDLDNLRALLNDDGFIPPNAFVWMARVLEALGDELRF